MYGIPGLGSLAEHCQHEGVPDGAMSDMYMYKEALIIVVASDTKPSQAVAAVAGRKDAEFVLPWLPL